MSRHDVISIASFLASSLDSAVGPDDAGALARLGDGQLVIDARSGACTHDDRFVPLAAAVQVWCRLADELDRQRAESAALSVAELRLRSRVRRVVQSRQRICVVELAGTAAVATVTGSVARVDASCLRTFALAPEPTAMARLRAQVSGL